MKTIDTLVKDIYNLFEPEKDIELSEEELDKHLDSFTTSIKETMKNILNEKPRERRNLRLSAIGKPARQLWYDKNDTKEVEPLASNVRIKFLYGHLLEDLLILLSRIAGHEVTELQKEVSVNGIKGHQDCMIDGVLVDCKSASGRSFEKFSNNKLHTDDPFGYIAQISAYAEGNGVDEAAFLVIDKQHGNICLTNVHSLEMINAKERIDYLKGVMDKNTPPDRCYSDVPDGISGNHKLAIGCLYCSHKRTCWSDANQGQGLRAFNYAKGLRFLTKVGKVPNVEEVTDW
jgi:hypothetical protein|tara:strand:+ start:1549 stop:2412 length:864 start_codon:yes stop_codon:yes gene_type:complete